MKILSNFDTHFSKQLLEQYTQTFGEGNVLSVHRSKMYYYRYVVRPLLLWLILFSAACYYVYTNSSNLSWFPSWLPIVFWSIFGLYLLLIVRKFMKFLIEYKMDFLIVTPREVMKYNQSGLFNREVEKLQTNHIKSISTSKKGMLKSFFDVGSLKFLAEGQSDNGDIDMEDIDAVEDTERKIIAILGLDKA